MDEKAQIGEERAPSWIGEECWLSRPLRQVRSSARLCRRCGEEIDVVRGMSDVDPFLVATRRIASALPLSTGEKVFKVSESKARVYSTALPIVIS